MTFSVILELGLCFLLALTLIYCIVLERKLANLRKGQSALKTTFRDLNIAIENAGAALHALKATAGSAAETLDERIRRARGAADELSVLTASGERIAERFDRAVRPQNPAPQPAAGLPSGSVMNRLDALRTVR
jgi:hypothetical protein